MAATATARKYIDNAPTPTLTGAINGTATVVTLSTLVGLPTSYPYFGTLDLGTATAEVVKVTGTPGTNQLTIARNANGLGVYSHSSSGTFDHTLVAADLQDANDHSVATGGVHGVTGSVVGTSDTQTLSNKTLTSPTINTPTFSAGVGLVPTGAILQHGGILAPAGFLLCQGQAVSRTTFAALLSALSVTLTGTTSSTNNIVNCSAADATTLGALGLQNSVGRVEGPGIPAGTWITGVGSTQFTMSNTATATGTVSIIVFPYGNGNASTTFNVPNLSARAANGSDGTTLGNVGGAATHSHTLAAGYAQIALATNNLGFKSSTASVVNWTGDFTYPVTRAADGTTRTTGVNLGGTTDTTNSLPPYLSLNFIIKT